MAQKSPRRANASLANNSAQTLAGIDIRHWPNPEYPFAQFLSSRANADAAPDYALSQALPCIRHLRKRKIPLRKTRKRRLA